MRAISAADAVSFAIQRTKEFLFRPFNWGTYLKLGLVAIITEGLGSNFNSSSHRTQTSSRIDTLPWGTPPGNAPAFPSPFHLAPVWIAAIVAAVLLAIVISVFVFYLVTRLRFAYFHCLVNNTKEIRPGWWIYRTQAMRFFWLNLVVGFCFLLVVALLAIPFFAGFMRLYQETQQGNPLNIGLLLSLVLPLIPIVLLLVLAAVLADIVLRDCMMPHIALDDATADEAWSQVWAHINAEKKQFFVYALLRIALPIVAVVGLFMVLLIPGLMVAGSVAAIEYGIHSTFANATGASALVGILLQAFFGLLAFGFLLLAGICLGGPVSTGIREYALIFYGGRYRELGDILYPQPPAAANGPIELA
jgi:hypothetical protein